MSCPICGMPPRDGEPCCTREYAKGVVRVADAKIRALQAEVERLRDMLGRHWKVIEDAMPYIPGSSFVAGEIDALETGKAKEIGP